MDTTGSVRTRLRVGHRVGFVVIALAFTTAMAFSTLPTPLYVLYQERDGYPTFLITVIFAAYALGVIVSLLLFGHVSDVFGRRGVIVVALLVELVAALMFIVWNDTVGLIAARIVTGLGIGALTGTATAHLGELHAVYRPASPSTANAVVSLSNIGGLALGPLIAGILAEFAPLPLVTPFVVFAVLLALGVIGVIFVPETVNLPEKRPTYRPQKPTVPTRGRGLFVAAGGAAFAGFAVFGLFTALGPSVMSAVLDENSRLAAGIVASLVFASAALTQLGTGSLKLRTQVWLGSGLMLGGAVLLAVSVLVASLPLFVASSVVAGAGVGVMFRVAISVAASLAPPEQRGGVLAALYLIVYAGLSIPVLLIGAAELWLPLTAVLLVFAALIIVLIAASTPSLARRASESGSSPTGR